MILIATALFPPEPVVSANISYDLAVELSKQKEVFVIAPKPTRPYGMQFNNVTTFNSFKYVQLNSYTCPQSKIIGRFYESYSLGQEIKRFVQNNHSHIEAAYGNVWPLFAQKALVEICEEYGIPVVLHIQDIYPESLTSKMPLIGNLVKKLFLPLDTKNLRKTTSVIAISEQMKSYLSKSRGIDSKNIEVVRNWQDDIQFLSVSDDAGLKSTNEVHKFTFMYLGSISPSAGVDTLIRAFSKAKVKNAQLIIAGSGSDKHRCMKIASQIDSQIIFVEVEPKNVPRVQSKADILLLPLKKGIANTALPSKLTAYMLSGKPIVASVDESSEVAQIIKEYQAGWVCEPENIRQLAKIMEEAYSRDKGCLKILGENSLTYAIQNLTRPVNIQRLATTILERVRK